MIKVRKVWVIVMCSLTVLYILRLGLRMDHLPLRLLTGSMMKNLTIHGFSHSETETIFIGATICGSKNHAESALMMMKSAILFRGKLHVCFLIVCAKPLQQYVHDELEILLDIFGKVFTYDLRDIYYPKKKEQFWRKWYKECSTERLFYPYIFKNVEIMVHIDSDVLFINELSCLWQHAYKMNESQMFAIAPDRIDVKEVAEGKLGHPFSKAPSLNSGILIMHLKKFVEFGWLQYLQQLVELFPERFLLPDQDIIRFTALFHPDKLYPLSCKYNMDQFICRSPTPCKDAETEGIDILHGAQGGFVWYKPFKTIMTAFQQYRFGVDPKIHLITLLKNALESLENKFCGFPSTVISNNTFKALSAD